MTTDPIRDEAVKVLAEAFDERADDFEQDPGVNARLMLDASPTFARRLALGTAWDAAVAALPEGMDGPNIIHYEDYTGARSWIAEAGVSPNGARVWADAPELALAALAAKLGGGK